MSFIKSKSEKFLERRGNIPQISAIMAQSVSEYRRDMLANEVANGLFSDGSYRNIKNELTDAGNVTSSVGIIKNAQVTTTNYRGNNDTVKQTPEIYSPLWLNSNLNLPRDRATINAWCRSFYALNPFVHNAINLHSTYPISKLNIKCANKEVENFFNDMIEEIDLMNICVQIAQEFWLLGEAFVYAELDISKGKWSRLFIQNPDYMIVKRTAIASDPIIMLRPDENLKRIVFSNKPSDIEQRKQLNSYIIDCVKRGENIPLDGFNVSHLSRKISPYEIRGTGLPVCIFRQLMLFDKLRESKYAQADNMINPLTLVKIGGGDGGYKPTFADLENWRSIFEEAQYDKDFKIFTHEGVTIERIGAGSGIYDISSDITQLVKEIYTGLQVPSVLMDGGSDTTYANGGVALDVLRQRYMQFRNMLATWLKRKIFAPISKLQGFYEYKGNGNKSEKQLIVPEVEWNHMSLFDAGDYIQNLINLTQGEGEAKRVSLTTLYKSLGLEWEDEMRKMRKEAICAAIAKKEKAALEAMDLTTLRSLSDDDEIMEPSSTSESAVPGESSAEKSDLGTLPGMELPNASPSIPPVTPPT
jgi:hypothetical protein